MRLEEQEEIIRLIYKGFDIELLSFELDIPIEQLQEYQKILQLRRFAKESVKIGKIEEAKEMLKSFILSTEINLIEKVILLKLNAYSNIETINKEDLQEIEEERKRIGFSRDIDEVLEELKVQIPKRKNSNIRKKELQNKRGQLDKEKQPKENERKIIEKDYEEVIRKYKTQIASNPQEAQEKKNLLAFAYFKAGEIDQSREILIKLVQETNSFMAYRQLVHIEKLQKNFNDAKLWAYSAIDNFPNSIQIREQLISIAKEENDNQEIIKQLKDIISINPYNEKNKKRLREIINKEER